MLPSVYIETTVPSYYHETRTTHQAITWRNATREWWDLHRHRFRLCTSALVVAELTDTPKAKSVLALSLLDSVEMLPELAGTQALAATYIKQKLMPKGALGDAGHLATASIHGIDFLLTWNCRHIANANKFRHLSVLNLRLGLSVPILTTPLNLIPEKPR